MNEFSTRNLLMILFLVVLSQEASGDDDPKVIPNEEWARRLTPEQYFCTREGGTEPVRFLLHFWSSCRKIWGLELINCTNTCLQPFSGQYLNHKAEGHYTCVCCSTELFSSKSKYDSGSGWPSFFAALDDSSNSSAVIRRKDISHGMVRNEIICKNVRWKKFKFPILKNL